MAASPPSLIGPSVMKTTMPGETRAKATLRWFALAGLAIVFTWGGVTYAIACSLPSWSERGALGDSFGAVNSLFSGLAFAGILFALHFQRQELGVQREELAAQREELKLTRNELARSAVAQESANKALTLQLGTMRATAKLQALSSLIDAYGHKIEKAKQSEHKKMLTDNRVKYVDSLESLLRSLDNESR